MQNIHLRFDRYYIGQIYGGDFAKFCGLLRIYELNMMDDEFQFTVVENNPQEGYRIIKKWRVAWPIIRE